ncbi:MAG: hypothetical protein ABI422_03320 [Sphingomicrobium sp.]
MVEWPAVIGSPAGCGVAPSCSIGMVMALGAALCGFGDLRLAASAAGLRAAALLVVAFLADAFFAAGFFAAGIAMPGMFIPGMDCECWAAAGVDSAAKATVFNATVSLIFKSVSIAR